jgi:hypothetical protein
MMTKKSKRRWLLVAMVAAMSVAGFAAVQVTAQDEGMQDARVVYLDGPARQICRRNHGFLFAVKDMVDAVLDGRSAPFSDCYIHAARRYTLHLEKTKRVVMKKVGYKLHYDGKQVESRYTNLIQAKFRVINHSNNRTWPGGSDSPYLFDYCVRSASGGKSRPDEIFVPDAGFRRAALTRRLGGQLIR